MALSCSTSDTQSSIQHVYSPASVNITARWQWWQCHTPTVLFCFFYSETWLESAVNWTNYQACKWVNLCLVNEWSIVPLMKTNWKGKLLRISLGFAKYKAPNCGLLVGKLETNLIATHPISICGICCILKESPCVSAYNISMAGASRGQCQWTVYIYIYARPTVFGILG